MFTPPRSSNFHQGDFADFVAFAGRLGVREVAFEPFKLVLCSTIVTPQSACILISISESIRLEIKSSIHLLMVNYLARLLSFGREPQCAARQQSLDDAKIITSLIN